MYPRTSDFLRCETEGVSNGIEIRHELLMNKKLDAVINDHSKDLEAEYNKSVFHGYSFEAEAIYTTCPGSRVLTQRDTIQNMFIIRGMQLITDLMIRKVSKVCAPHVINRIRNDFDNSSAFGLPYDRKWSLFEKASANFAQTMLYVISACKKTSMRGALLPIVVGMKNGSSTLHANMLYLDTRSSPAIVYIFEPNGASFTQETDTITNVKESIRIANKLSNKITFLPEPVIAVVKGIQSAFNYTKTVTSTSITERWDGVAICSAVTYWTVYHWLNTDREFTEFCASLEKAIIKKPDYFKNNMMRFLKKFTKFGMNHFDRRFKTLILLDSAPEGLEESFRINAKMKIGSVPISASLRVPCLQ